MLIQALCDYYDILAKDGRVLPDGYSAVNIHYKISLTPDGKIDGMISCQQLEMKSAGKGKTKGKKIPTRIILPQRTEKPGIDANIADHRPLYIFGLNMEGDTFSAFDRTNKAQKSHKAFVEENLNFIQGLNTPVVNAYRAFLEKWKPEEETENKWLLSLGKEYGKSGFVFCLSGNPDYLLHEDPEFQKRWETVYNQKVSEESISEKQQCAVMGKEASIARIHNKIKGVYGGLATGSVLVGFNNDSENSYGREQAYNSNISEEVMKKYTEALNFLLSSEKHKALLDDMTVVFWAMSHNEACEDLFMKLMMGVQDTMDEHTTEEMLLSLLSDASELGITQKRLQTLELIDPNVDFYMLGLKPNSSRLSVKFMLKKKYADVLWNIARFQNDLQISKKFHTVALWQIKKELVSPKSNEKVNPALMAKLFQSIIYGSPYPVFLLDRMVCRVKTDREISWYRMMIRVGIIKAYINRNESKEELKVSLDRSNHGQAYLCGRLFAVLEVLQQEASHYSLNRTIRDTYFSSASAKPALVFPRLIRLAQAHLNKVKNPGNYQRQIGEIVDKLEGGFPDNLLLKDQGKFIVGYFQQYQISGRRLEENEQTEEKEEK